MFPKMILLSKNIILVGTKKFFTIFTDLQGFSYHSVLTRSIYMRLVNLSRLFSYFRKMLESKIFYTSMLRMADSALSGDVTKTNGYCELLSLPPNTVRLPPITHKGKIF